MKNFEEKMIEGAQGIIDLTKECVNDFGCKFDECFPATTYKIITVEGKEYRLKMEVILLK